MCIDHINIAPRLPTTVYITSILFVFIFRLYLPELLYLDMHTDHVNDTLTLLTMVCIISILIFPYFIAIFTSITIFGIVHRPSQQYLNIVNNSLHHVYFFLDIPWFSDYIYIDFYIWKCAQTIQHYPTLSITVYIISILVFLIFHDFLAIFALITILGNAHRPCKHFPNIVNNSLHHVYSFFLILWVYIYIDYHIRKCAQTMLTLPQYYQQ